MKASVPKRKRKSPTILFWHPYQPPPGYPPGTPPAPTAVCLPGFLKEPEPPVVKFAVLPDVMVPPGD